MKQVSRILIFFCSLILILGFLLKTSHVRFWAYLSIIGIIGLCTSLIIAFFGNFDANKRARRNTSIFPNIWQSVLMTLFLIVCYIWGFSLTNELSQVAGGEVAKFIVYFVSVGIPFLLFHWIRTRKTDVNGFGFRIDKLYIIPIISLCSVTLYLGLSNPLLSILLDNGTEMKMMGGLSRQFGLISFMLIVFVAPLLEELIFRGIILDSLLKRHNVIFAILFSAFLFSIAHLNRWQFIAGMILGVYSGWLYFRTKSILPSIIAHISFNACGFLIRYFSNLEIEVLQDTSSIVTVIIILNLVSIFAIYILNKIFLK